MRLTRHAQGQIVTRLHGIASVQEIVRECEALVRDDEDKSVVVKTLPQMIVCKRPDQTPEQWSKGDCIVAVCKRGHIVTVMLRKSWSKSDNHGGIS